MAKENPKALGDLLDDEPDDESENLKVDALKKEYVLKNKYYPRIEKNIQKYEHQLFRHISKYRDKNINIFSNPYPLNFPIWSDDDSQVLFDIAETSEQEMVADLVERVKTIPYTLTYQSFAKDEKKRPNLVPINIIFTLLLKYYIENMEEEKLHMIYYYMAYSIYRSVFTKYFKFPPREETMIYTVNNLTKKFKLKQFLSIDVWLFTVLDRVSVKYKQRIKRSSDVEINYVISQIKTRINNFMKNIKNEYEKNNTNRSVIFKSSEFTDDDNIRNMDSTLGNVEALAQEYTTKFFSQTINQNIINFVAKKMTISSSELRTTLNILLSQQRIDEVKEFYASLFYIYLNDETTSIDTVKTAKFLGVMDKIYRKSNTNDKNIMIIKKHMNVWLQEGSKTYRSSNREATLSNFRKAIFYYFILSVTFNK